MSDYMHFNPNIRAETEELDFYSYTRTYNRDGIPCVSFSIPDSFVKHLDDLERTVACLEEKCHEQQ